MLIVYASTHTHLTRDAVPRNEGREPRPEPLSHTGATTLAVPAACHFTDGG